MLGALLHFDILASRAGCKCSEADVRHTISMNSVGYAHAKAPQQRA
jgi:hypothetical protein